MSKLSSALIEVVLDVARRAGDAIMGIYHLPIAEQAIAYKSDNSPLTRADTEAHHIIKAALEQATPTWPIISEEGEIPPLADRQQWTYHWLVDPLDGTKEFVARTGDFSVNIALIHEGRPVFGVLYAPSHHKLYWGAVGLGAFCRHQQAEQRIQTATASTDLARLRIVASRRHALVKMQQRLPFVQAEQITHVGSAIKFGHIAENLSDAYFRLGPTSEWDTAAGQCILEQAGGCVLDLDGQPLRYNAKDDVINPAFIALSDAALLPILQSQMTKA